MGKLNEKASEAVKTPRELSTFEKAQRTLMTCMLFEDNFYEDGQSCADRLASYVKDLSAEDCRKLLKEAKFDNKLRHAPLFWANRMLKEGKISQADVEMVTDRVDEMADFLALYWGDKSNKHGIPKVLQKGLANRLHTFDEYQLAKYKGKDDSIKLRDVIRVAHATPKDDAESALWKRALDGNLAVPDTWEVAISACGSDKDKKKAEWERLLTEKTDKGFNKLGALAMLRNIRNMTQAGVPENKIKEGIKNSSTKRVLPFQIITSARYNPDYEDVLQDKLLESAGSCEKLAGDTIIMVDISGSMHSSVSRNSETTREDAACGVAAICREVCDNAYVYAFDTKNHKIGSSYRGFPLIEAIKSSGGGGTSVIECTNEAIADYKKSHENKYPSRVIVITDEQTNSDYGYYGLNSSCRRTFDKLNKVCAGYVVNVGTYENGVAYSKGDNRWTHISGWSDNVVRFISTVESRKFN